MDYFFHYQKSLLKKTFNEVLRYFLQYRYIYNTVFLPNYIILNKNIPKNV